MNQEGRDRHKSSDDNETDIEDDSITDENSEEIIIIGNLRLVRSRTRFNFNNHHRCHRCHGCHRCNNFHGENSRLQSDLPESPGNSPDSMETFEEKIIRFNPTIIKTFFSGGIAIIFVNIARFFWPQPQFFYPRDLMINSLTYDPEVEILTDGQIDALLAKRINELPQRDKALEVKPIEPVEPIKPIEPIV